MITFRCRRYQQAGKDTRRSAVCLTSPLLYCELRLTTVTERRDAIQCCHVLFIVANLG